MTGEAGRWAGGTPGPLVTERGFGARGASTGKPAVPDSRRALKGSGLGLEL